MINSVEYPNETLYGIFKKTSETFPDRPAVEFMGRIKTYREMLHSIDCASTVFKKAGVKAGDRVAVCLPNSIPAVLSLYALNRIGAAAVMINPLSSSDGMARYLLETQCSGLLLLDVFFPVFHKLKDSCKSLKTVFLVRLLEEMPFLHATAAGFRLLPRYAALWKCKGITNMPVWQKLLKDADEDKNQAWNNPDSETVIFFSGGTSAKPKAIVHSSRSINASVFQSLCTEPPICEGMSMLAVLPIFHVFGLTVAIHTAFAAGGRCILVPRFHANQVARLIVKKKPTYMAGVPTLFEGLLRSRVLKSARRRGKLDMRGFRLAFCGGDTLPEKTYREFSRLIRENGGETGYISEGYGLTECCPVTLMPKGEFRKSCIGKPFPGIELKVVKRDTEELLAYNQEGEICISSPSLMLRYLDSGIKNGSAMRQHKDGKIWLHTGDIGSLDDQGYVYYHFRDSRLVKVSGYAVNTSCVEDVLMTSPLVRRCTVVPIPDSYTMVKLKAIIVLKQGCAPKKAKHELTAFCRSKLMPWAVPKLFEFRPQLPMTPLGKVITYSEDSADQRTPACQESSL